MIEVVNGRVAIEAVVVAMIAEVAFVIVAFVEVEFDVVIVEVEFDVRFVEMKNIIVNLNCTSLFRNFLFIHRKVSAILLNYYFLVNISLIQTVLSLLNLRHVFCNRVIELANRQLSLPCFLLILSFSPFFFFSEF